MTELFHVCVVCSQNSVASVSKGTCYRVFMYWKMVSEARAPYVVWSELLGESHAIFCVWSFSVVLYFQSSDDTRTLFIVLVLHVIDKFTSVSIPSRTAQQISFGYALLCGKREFRLWMEYWNSSRLKPAGEVFCVLLAALKNSEVLVHLVLQWLKENAPLS